MLASVDVRSLPEAQFVEKTEGPNGPAPLENWLRCGKDPARSRMRRAALLVVELFSGISPIDDGEGVWKGEWDGVGREDFARDGIGPNPFVAPPGENRDGTVPALALLAVDGRLSGVGSCAKSGKPSVGDSGMFSRRGVEFPLVGGPQTFTGRPSWE